MKPIFTLFVVMLLSIGLQANHIPGHVDERTRRQFFGAQSAVNIQNNQFASSASQQNAQTRQARPVELTNNAPQQSVRQGHGGFGGGAAAEHRGFANQASVVSGGQQAGHHFNSRAGQFRQNSMQIEGQDSTVLSAQSGFNKANLVSSSASNVGQKVFVSGGRVQQVVPAQTVEMVASQAVASNKFNQAVNTGVIGSQVRNQQQFVNQGKFNSIQQGVQSSQVEAEESFVGQRVNNKLNNKLSQAVVSESQVGGNQFVSGRKQLNKNNRFNKQHQQQVVEDSNIESVVSQAEQGSAFSGQHFANKNKQFVNSGFESNAQVEQSGSQFVSGGKKIHGNMFSNKQHNQQVIQQQQAESNVQESSSSSFGQSEQQQVSAGQRFANKNQNNFNSQTSSVAAVNSGFESAAQPTVDQVQEIGSQFFSRQNNKQQAVNVNSGVVEQSSIVNKNFIKTNNNINNQAATVASIQSNSNNNFVNLEAHSGVAAVAGDRGVSVENKANLVSGSSINSGISVQPHGQQAAEETTVMQASSVKSGSFGGHAKKSQASFFSEVSPTGFAKLDAGNFF